MKSTTTTLALVLALSGAMAATAQTAPAPAAHAQHPTPTAAEAQLDIPATAQAAVAVVEHFGNALAQGDLKTAGTLPSSSRAPTVNSSTAGRESMAISPGSAAKANCTPARTANR